MHEPCLAGCSVLMPPRGRRESRGRRWPGQADRPGATARRSGGGGQLRRRPKIPPGRHAIRRRLVVVGKEEKGEPGEAGITLSSATVGLVATTPSLGTKQKKEISITIILLGEEEGGGRGSGRGASNEDAISLESGSPRLWAEGVPPRRKRWGEEGLGITAQQPWWRSTLVFRLTCRLLWIGCKAFPPFDETTSPVVEDITRGQDDGCECLILGHGGRNLPHVQR